LQHTFPLLSSVPDAHALFFPSPLFLFLVPLTFLIHFCVVEWQDHSSVLSYQNPPSKNKEMSLPTQTQYCLKIHI
jgi:predicted membrane metal-binding protein